MGCCVPKAEQRPTLYLFTPSQFVLSCQNGISGSIPAEFTIASDVGPSDTTVYVTPGTAFGLGGNAVLAVDTGSNAEDMNVLAVTVCDKDSTLPQCSNHLNQDIFTVQRGFEGNQTSHAAGTAVLGLDIIHLNGKGTAIVAQAIATYLSSYKKP